MQTITIVTSNSEVSFDRMEDAAREIAVIEGNTLLTYPETEICSTHPTLKYRTVFNLVSEYLRCGDSIVVCTWSELIFNAVRAAYVIFCRNHKEVECSANIAEVTGDGKIIKTEMNSGGGYQASDGVFDTIGKSLDTIIFPDAEEV